MFLLAFEWKSISRCLILLYILSLSLQQTSIGFNISLSAALAALCVFFSLIDKSIIHKPVNNLLVLFVSCLFLIWALSVCLGLSILQETNGLSPLSNIINKSFLLNLIFMSLVSHILIHDRDFLLLVMKIFLITSVSLACIYILIVTINFDQFEVSTAKNIDVAFNVALTNHGNMPVLFSSDGRAILGNQNPALIGMQFFFASIISFNSLIGAIKLKDRSRIILHVCLIAILSCGVALTGTRTAFFATTIICLVCFIASHSYEKSQQIAHRLAQGVLMSTALAAIILNPSFKYRIFSSLIFLAEKVGLEKSSDQMRSYLPRFNTQYFETKATGGRFEIWHDYIILIQKHLPWGAGFLGVSTSELVLNENVDGVSSSHSIVLDVLSWSGIPGFLLLSISALTIFLASLKSDLIYKHQSSLAICLAVLIYSQTLPISTDKTPWLIMSIALGLALSKKEPKV